MNTRRGSSSVAERRPLEPRVRGSNPRSPAKFTPLWEPIRHKRKPRYRFMRLPSIMRKKQIGFGLDMISKRLGDGKIRVETSQLCPGQRFSTVKGNGKKFRFLQRTIGGSSFYIVDAKGKYYLETIKEAWI